MSENGNRKPPRPRIEMLSAAEPEEAAAVIAAVEQFIAETSPAPAPAAAVIASVEQFIAETAPAPAASVPVRPWQRAALLEGVRAKEAFASPWGEERTWGERHSQKS